MAPQFLDDCQTSQIEQIVDGKVDSLIVENLSAQILPLLAN